MKIEIIKRKGFAISIIAFPLMLLTGFIMHPNLLKLEALQTVEQLVGRFHNPSGQNEMFLSSLPNI
jgi:hypothetical protein